MMIDGVISCEPSHETPANGGANVDEATPTLYPEPDTPGKVNVPSSAAVAPCTFAPRESKRFSFTPGRPSSPFSTLPGVPPPGEKSRQTTPEIAPCFAGGVTACFAPDGT